MVTIKKGLDLPITGCPEQHIEVASPVSSVALLGDDYVGMKPTMLVAEGDTVRAGQPVFEDKKTPGVIFTAPASGRVTGVVRGAKRKFEALTIQVEGDERVEFDQAKGGTPSGMGRQGLTDVLVQSGLWTAFRGRPYGKVPAPGTTPHSIFVTAIDTNPLAADPAVVLADRKDQFSLGLEAIAELTDGKVFVCKSPNSEIPGSSNTKIEIESFGGPHPAGLVGTHIHHLDPVGPTKTVWHIGYQDVAAIGSLLINGTLDPRRVIALAGPVVKQPRLLETRLGANVSELIDGECEDVKVRPISGSVLCGRTALDPHQYLGRYHNQVSVLAEGDDREFLGWQKPGFDKYSVTRVFASAMTPGKKFPFTTSTGGSVRAMVPLGTYEKVVPLDILPTQLLRALIVRDTDQAQQLGALELDEEDLALCTFVCPGKYEYGSLLRENLTTIEREG
ncbi:Na(+)-translocating NADH-quinone reductase subunit A [Crateriforma conspicua]|uniref:Na(+)-translocating NADH-quinone reductase subunit A n=1 Tax=Crateriforma conspicua TaxID=2527996 RepID=A0A5C5Y9B1_9PLAN|nr:Na(+)-translocating NADH-quinone reductase subunit A [Crateriforma conspicua]QDV64555.1 Na(+)-translocating NADH-quinone reductase subunit A [Crateriforma conspicua]TWT69952.1 Na(+)-translocating NADH-quinone reductase subunit A [Crateriforma conspicua]